MTGLPLVRETRLFRLSPSERVEFEQTLPAYNALVADLNLINVDSFRFLAEFQRQLEDRITGGALLICFTSRPNLHSPEGLRNKYSWLPGFDSSAEIREDLVDKVAVAQEANGIAEAFASLVRGFYATCSFPKGFGADPYNVVLRGDDGTPVGLLKRVGSGCVLLVPQCEEKRSVIESILGWWAGETRAEGMTPARPEAAPAGAGEDEEGETHEFEAMPDDVEGDVQDLLDLVPETAAVQFGGARDELDALLEEKPGGNRQPPPMDDKTQRIASPPPSSPSAPPSSAPLPSAPPPAAGGAPAWLDEFKAQLPYLSKLVAGRTGLETQARKLLEEAAEVQRRIDALSAWDVLLHGDAGAVASALARFFLEVLGAQAAEAATGGEPPTLKVRTAESQFLVHVVVGARAVPQSAGRALLRALADDDADSKGILVARGTGGAPPPTDPAGHFEPALVKLAQKRGLVLVPVEALYRIGLAAAQEAGWQAEPLVEALAGQEGIFNQF